MAEEMKSAYLEKRFKSYIDGVAVPAIDLSRAKAAVKRRGSRGKWAAAFTTVAACILIAVVAFTAQFPLGDGSGGNHVPATSVYSIADASPAAASYTALKEKYPEKVAPFAAFSFATNASADYVLYELNGQAVLLRVELGYISARMQAQAIVYLDLSEGKQEAEELSDYADLTHSGYDYLYETTYENGEYVSKAYMTIASSSCCIDFVSNDSEALEAFISLIR